MDAVFEYFEGTCSCGGEIVTTSSSKSRDGRECYEGKCLSCGAVFFVEQTESLDDWVGEKVTK